MNKPKIRMRREDIRPDENLCDYCTAKCCRYFALSIDTPRTAADFDYLRWYLLHDRASLFVEGTTWYLLVHTTCKHLQDDHRCGIYETRPKICRDYTTHECEYDDSYTYDWYFETPEQIEEYANARFNTPETFRSPKPQLSVLN
ncbi:YkgJ family cysteine cluster protein [Mariniblastus fucicola]|nr:YkgJ family cysteine cluster protein [Mariniblastus fucicola]